MSEAILLRLPPVQSVDGLWGRLIEKVIFDFTSRPTNFIIECFKCYLFLHDDSLARWYVSSSPSVQVCLKKYYFLLRLRKPLGVGGNVAYWLFSIKEKIR